MNHSIIVLITALIILIVSIFIMIRFFYASSLKEKGYKVADEKLAETKIYQIIFRYMWEYITRHWVFISLLFITLLFTVLLSQYFNKEIILWFYLLLIGVALFIGNIRNHSLVTDLSFYRFFRLTNRPKQIKILFNRKALLRLLHK